MQVHLAHALHCFDHIRSVGTVFDESCNVVDGLITSGYPTKRAYLGALLRPSCSTSM
ncbi:hypothetical protein HYPSUDRAFT_43239 [Hypholoma sublateritium FD-334 SS-4]|uniref:Uncharacterized protein n=1 Tax=Hypholoma sublateritium (strain FD-334 SS-4) TaxID=945553 RepID=A0A0D2MAF5_HYPSF|nr:hypothetical protein HYPSUDRAFT_43239 [Hypholoma sublateritium FD-334 SS-4]